MTAINVLGPFNNYDNRLPGYQYIRNITQYNNTMPEFYYFNYILNYTGEWQLSIRVQADWANYPAYTYPILVKVFSDRISAQHSTADTAHYYVGNATVTVTLRDKFGNTLTDQYTNELGTEGQTFITYVNYSRYGDNPVPDWDQNMTRDDYMFLDYNYSTVGNNSTYHKSGFSNYSIDIYPE